MPKIAIIDDNETNLLFMKMLLSKVEDCDAACFLSAVEALERLRDAHVDLVIVDYMMPLMDGLEFIQAYRSCANANGVPIVMVTAHDERDIRARAVALGATDFLSKPVDTLEFSTRVRNLLQLRTAQNRLRDKTEWLAEEVLKAGAETRASERYLVICLARAAEYRDENTGCHIIRMARYSRLIAAQIGLRADERYTLFRAAPMHDIGKVGIPDSILLKPGPLTADEFTVMKTHTTIGHRILSGREDDLIRTAADIALCHHEKIDGTGYPNGLSGESIPIGARIVAVADVFDALTSERPYKKAWPLERARAQLVQIAGSHLDPACVDAFLSRWPEVVAISETKDVDIDLEHVGADPGDDPSSIAFD